MKSYHCLMSSWKRVSIRGNAITKCWTKVFASSEFSKQNHLTIRYPLQLCHSCSSEAQCLSLPGQVSKMAMLLLPVIETIFQLMGTGSLSDFCSLVERDFSCLLEMKFCPPSI